MSPATALNPPGPVGIDYATPASDQPMFSLAFRLGESQKAFLGVLSHKAWKEYADDGRLLVAIEPPARSGRQTVFLGYATFRLARSRIALTHLVVDPAARGRRVARGLVDEISRRHPDRRGIAARCRRDLPANTMWPHLNFVALGDRPGRSAKGHLLTDWWRDHGFVDLMSWVGAPTSVTSVAMDANIFIDLHTDGPNSKSTRRIMLEELEGRIELLVTPELHNEIDRNNDAAERRRLHAQADTYPRLPVSAPEFDVHWARLCAALGKPPRTTQDVSDLKHVAYAAAAGVPILVTRDERARRKLGEMAVNQADVTIVTPHDLVTHVDQLENAPAYWPAALLGTGYTVEEATANDPNLAQDFAATSESGRELAARLQHLAERRPTSHRLIYRDPRHVAIALVGTVPTAGVLEVTVFRMRATALQTTLAAQIVSRLRPVAADARVEVIRVTDPHPDPLLYEALIADGYVSTVRGPVALAIRSICSVADADRHIEIASAVLTSEEKEMLAPLRALTANLHSGTSSSQVSMLERHLRPLRLIDAATDTWLAPIKAPRASALFGFPAGLFSRPEQLGISLEHVYYRAGRSGETAPARVLWYVSGNHFRQVIGCSELASVLDDAPDELYRRYRRLGVYDRTDVRAAANSTGAARALRLVNTEIFEAPMPLKRLQTLAQQHGEALRLVSMSRISPSLFGSILREVRGAV